MPITRSEMLMLAPMVRLAASLRLSPLLSDDLPVTLARAPGRLDVMGGIADYSGALVCQMPLAIAAGAAVQSRDDAQVVCRSAQVDRTVTVPIDALVGVGPPAVQQLLDGPDRWARYPIGCVWLLLQRGIQLPGVTLIIDSDAPLGGGVSSSAAIEVATMTALRALTRAAMSPLELAVACQQVENQIVGAPCGVMDQVASCMGQRDAMLRILCQPGADGLPAQVLGQLPVPRGYRFIGIHSGVSHDVSGDPYTDTRVAAFMGQKILAGMDVTDLTGGCLANVDASRFERSLAARLPQSMRGCDFIADYHATNDPVTTIDPEKTYRVRAATTHHVLDAQRVRDFVRCMEQRDLALAGKLMLASHRSYGECAGLGHLMTDRLVELAMEHQALGARVTGGGGGGTVAILLRDDERLDPTIDSICRRYTGDTGRPTMRFTDSGPGAAALGVSTVYRKDL